MKNLKVFSVLFASLCMGVCVFTACSSDDDDNNDGGIDGGNNSSTTSSYITDKDGNAVQLTHIEYADFGYDEHGKLNSFNYYGQDYSFDRNAFVLSDNYGTTIKFTFNDYGLISKIEHKFIDDYDNSNTSITYNYNSNHQLIKANISGSYSSKYSGYSNGTKTGTVTYTWTDGNMTKSVSEITTIGEEGGSSFTWKETNTNAYTYGSTFNVCKQFPFSLSNIINNARGGTNLFSMIGLFGVGPVNLPTKRVYTSVEIENNGEPYTYSENENISFILNENGTIKSEVINDYAYDYIYKQ